MSNLSPGSCVEVKVKLPLLSETLGIFQVAVPNDSPSSVVMVMSPGLVRNIGLSSSNQRNQTFQDHAHQWRFTGKNKERVFVLFT